MGFYIFSFICGAVFGVLLMCIISAGGGED